MATHHNPDAGRGVDPGILASADEYASPRPIGTTELLADPRVARLLARIERLRAALQEIADGVDTRGDAMCRAEQALAEDDRKAAR